VLIIMVKLSRSIVRTEKDIRKHFDWVRNFSERKWHDTKELRAKPKGRGIDSLIRDAAKGMDL